MSRANRKRFRWYDGHPRRSVRDHKLVMAALRAGICPCESEAEEPGPEHIATCPWSDPDYCEGF